MAVYPSLTYRDVDAALGFLELAFGFEPVVVERDDEDAVGLAVMRHGDGMILIQPEVPEALHGAHAGVGWVYVVVEDPDAHYVRATTAGAEALSEPDEGFDGAQRGYSARDLEGNLWSFGTARPEG